MYSTNAPLPDGLIGVLKDLWPFLSYDGLGLDSDPTSAEALQALASYQHICDDDIRADFTQTSHIEQCLDDVPELSDSESISESETSELDRGIELDYVPFLNIELGESFDVSLLSHHFSDFSFLD
ncbi:hypothetical protein FCULG_00006276 [Fusarium culmorum]|uniref:Uncharacterized protein n=1 Tax=Fusarium culmorum TaxID=5516 RepID=A0A2T4GWT3_FUSCU|nr:hypothetical protein FCULG_00006276 [Fusarium culmorum]